MCRWITLVSSNPVSISDIILSPSNSLIQLSKDASYHPEFTDMNNHVTNGDGFGVGWYHINHCNELRVQATTTMSAVSDDEKKDDDNNGDGGGAKKKVMYAAVFKDTQPAWNNINLRELCMAVRSNCMIAHVRAASVFAGISQQNCHPFKAGTRLLFCHNGRIGNFDMVRRPFHQLLSDEAYIKGVRGTTDSETIFALICTSLSNDGTGISAYEQTEPFGHERLTNAVKKVLRTIETTLELVGAHDSNFSTLNFALTDGETVVVTRYCDKSPNVPPPSLYFAFGDSQKLHEELTEAEETRTPLASLPSTLSSQSSTIQDEINSNPDDANNNDEYAEKEVQTMQFESKPGTIYSDIDVNAASFIVASNPLTKTHTWHPMPKNSIMWYARGGYPELRLLRKHSRTKSFVLSKSWRQSRFNFEGLMNDDDDDDDKEPTTTAETVFAQMKLEKQKQQA